MDLTNEQAGGDQMWEEFEFQLKREVHTPITMSYDKSIKMAEAGIHDVVAKWKERFNHPQADTIPREAVKDVSYDGGDTWWVNNLREQIKAQADGEYISRQDAISEIREMAKWHTGDAFNADRVIQHLKQLPSVAIPNKVGHWISPKDFMWENPKCSECGFESADHDNYCPHCGCPMEIER